MQRNKTLKLTLIAALSIMPFGWAHADCHDINGQWAATVDNITDVNGVAQTVAGVANILFTSNTINYWLDQSLLGSRSNDFATGSYSIDQWCGLTAIMTFGSDGSQAFLEGVVVNRDEMTLILSNSAQGTSARVIAKRLIEF